MHFLFWDRIRDWVVLLVLLLASLTIMLSFNLPLVRSLRAVALEFTSWVEQPFARVRGYTQALDELERLREENIALASRVAQARNAVAENSRLRSLLDLRSQSAVPMVGARIIKQRIGSEQNLLVIDAGQADSVAVGMPVVNDQGIIGRVLEATEQYALVMPYLNTDFRVPAQVQELQAHGIVRWEGVDQERLLLEHVVRTEPVELGQLVVTSGFSGVFPAGYPIGEIVGFEDRPGRNELLIYVEPSAPLYKVDYVFVLLEMPSPEAEALEAEPAE